MTDPDWNNLHNSYSERDWSAKPSLFASTVRDYLPSNGSLLELGAGLGQDSDYFASLGLDVTATDLHPYRLEARKDPRLTIATVDLRKPLPYADANFDVVYAHLSLHYFDLATTGRIFGEIHRVLRPDGLFAFFTNATTDPEYGTGVKLERDFFDIEGVKKRYFSVASARHFSRAFSPLLLDDNGETYKDADKGVHGLIRFIGRRK